MNAVVRVLVVDDSAYIRKVVKQMLSRSPFIEVVGTARDGAEALELTEQLRPDVITLDLMMAGMDGFTFLRTQMARRPVPVVVVSIADEGSEAVLQALDAGAVDFLQKPTALATEKVFTMSDELIEKVKMAAKVPMAQLQPAPPLPSAPISAMVSKGELDVIVIGVSTGGPHALSFLLPQLPAELAVPIAIVLHMPLGYTEFFARKLDTLAALHVVEASEGMELRAGMAYLAPAGRHLTFRRTASGSVVTHLDLRPFDTPHRPAVDVLFQSAAEVFGPRVLGIVLTGMGSDGQQGAAWIKAQGGHIWTQSEDSCVVYGMPRAVDEALLSDQQVTLQALAQALIEVV